MAVAACLGPEHYECEGHLQCRRSDRSGLCTAAGWCAYPDDACESGYRFSEHAGDGAASLCVEPGQGSGDVGTGLLTDSASGGGTSVDPCSDGCDTPPGPCFVTEGVCDADTDQCSYAPRLEGDPCEVPGTCTMPGACDGAGACVPGAGVPCDEPPSPCHEAIGSCDLAEGCVYAPLSAGTPCEDGDGCTLDDACDGAGLCVAGEVCPSGDPCQVGACEAGACAFSPAADATSCGPNAENRCCAGACVDISVDASHCGGCAMTCGAAKSCQPVDDPPECSPGPPDTSGRCTCDANTDCPHGQICRTVAPGANLCAPEGDRDCDGIYVDVVSCPNFCTYP